MTVQECGHSYDNSWIWLRRMDINRKINGVIKVDQAADEVIEQELNEYVITKELKKHFITFFNYYSDALDEPTADTLA